MVNSNDGATLGLDLAQWPQVSAALDTALVTGNCTASGFVDATVPGKPPRPVTVFVVCPTYASVEGPADSVSPAVRFNATHAVSFLRYDVKVRFAQRLSFPLLDLNTVLIGVFRP